MTAARPPTADLVAFPRPEPMADAPATSAIGRLLAVIRPESDRERTLYVGFALLAGGFLLAGLPALALIVPGAVLTAIALFTRAT